MCPLERCVLDCNKYMSKLFALCGKILLNNDGQPRLTHIKRIYHCASEPVRVYSKGTTLHRVSLLLKTERGNHTPK